MLLVACHGFRDFKENNRNYQCIMPGALLYRGWSCYTNSQKPQSIQHFYCQESPVNFQLATYLSACALQGHTLVRNACFINHLGRLLQTQFQKGCSKFCLHSAPWEKNFPSEKQYCLQPNLVFSAFSFFFL